jgi:putative transposase
MPRMARAVVPGIPHHLTQRGNRREDVFFDDGDWQPFLGRFHEAIVAEVGLTGKYPD